MSVFDVYVGDTTAPLSAIQKATEALRDHITKANLDWSNVPHAARTAADLLYGAQTALGSSGDADLEDLRRAAAAIVRACTPIAKIVDNVVDYLNHVLLDDAGLVPLKNMQIAGLQYEVDSAFVAYLPSSIESKALRESDMSHADLVAFVEMNVFPAIAPVTTVDDITKSALLRIVDESFAKSRIQGLYDMVVNFDEGNPSLWELKETMTTPELRRLAVTEFCASAESRLLNGGVDTIDIIEAYLATIKVFSSLDPQGVLLQAVSKPIRDYLKERADTVDELAMGLFGVEDSRLKFLSKCLGVRSSFRDNRDDQADAMSWVPDPIDAPTGFVQEQTTDTVATLLSLYDNKEVFIKKLASLFSDKLIRLSKTDNLERLADICTHLVSRFGEADMQKIRVMIHDFLVGREGARDIHQKHQELSNYTAIAISAMYWPHIRDDASLKLPAEVARDLDEFARRYRELPAHSPYELHLINDKGCVKVTIELQDRQLDLDVSPEQATVIHAFQETGSLDKSALTEITGLEGTRLLESIQFWVNQGVLRLSGDLYTVIESLEDAPDTDAQNIIDPAVTASRQDDGIEEMRVYWSYIVGMLTNLGPLPVEKIHSFLVMFVPKDDPYVKTKAELESFLLAMVHDEKLRVVDEAKFALV